MTRDDERFIEEASVSKQDAAWLEYYRWREAVGFKSGTKEGDVDVRHHDNPKANLLDLLRNQAPAVWRHITGSTALVSR